MARPAPDTLRHSQGVFGYHRRRAFAGEASHMSTSSRAIRHRVATLAVASAVAATLGACSSDTKPTPKSTTTIPTLNAPTSTKTAKPATRMAVHDYYVGTGAPVLEFLRASAPLTTFPQPTR